jgi:hypothetical protein
MVLIHCTLTVAAVSLGLDTMCWHHVVGDQALLVHARDLTQAKGWVFEDFLLDSNYQTDLFHQTSADSAKLKAIAKESFDPFAQRQLSFLYDAGADSDSDDSVRASWKVSRSPLQTVPVDLPAADPLTTLGKGVLETEPTQPPVVPVPAQAPVLAVSAVADAQLSSRSVITRSKSKAMSAPPAAGCQPATLHCLDVTAELQKTLTSLQHLVVEDHFTDADPFRSAHSLIQNYPSVMDTLNTRQIVTFGLSLSAVGVAASVVSSSAPPRPLPFAGTLEADWSKTSRKVCKFAELHGDENMRTAFLKEMQGIVDAGVISTPVDLPRGQIAPKAVMLISLKSDGVTFKGRLVYRGDTQVDGLNFDIDEVYAPVMDRVSFRM